MKNYYLLSLVYYEIPSLYSDVEGTFVPACVCVYSSKTWTKIPSTESQERFLVNQ